jgi:ABC-type uncharacterized transport system permease subunit
VFQLTIFFLYIIAGLTLALTRLPAYAPRTAMLLTVATICGVSGVVFHLIILWSTIITGSGLSLSLGNTASFIGLQLALIALLGAIDSSLRGLAGGLLILAAIGAALTSGPVTAESAAAALGWQLQAHILISLFAYGLLSVGAIVAVYALVQDRRLQAGRLSSLNHIFAPLETTERLLFGITTAGCSILLLAIFSGFAFVDNLFAQHLVHKTALSILALILFGILIAGRQFAGWRGRRAIFLYLWGFVILCLAYFGSRFVLENVLGRTWG